MHQARLVPEPFMTATVLPRCPHCRGLHPLMREPVEYAVICPDCGGRAARYRTVNVKAPRIVGSLADVLAFFQRERA